MAIDSLKHQGVSADIYTYDTKGTTAGTNAILSQSKLKDMDIIFGPAHQSSIASVAAFADKNNIRLVVPFSPKVDQYLPIRISIRSIPTVLSLFKGIRTF